MSIAFIFFHGKEYNTYRALQYQRKLERTIRKQKQDVALLEKGGADQDDITAAKCRLRLTNKTYVDFSKEMGLRQQRERLKIARNTVANDTTRGIMNSERRMSNGQRTSVYHILAEDEQQGILSAAAEIKIPKEVLEFNTGSQTGFNDFTQKIHVRGDILPDLTSTELRDVLSERAVLAHEYYGHYMNHPSAFRIGDWRDEFRAS
jgi:hypothetical protein